MIGGTEDMMVHLGHLQMPVARSAGGTGTQTAGQLGGRAGSNINLSYNGSSWTSEII